MIQATDNPIDPVIRMLDDLKLAFNGAYFEMEALRMKADRLEKENLELKKQLHFLKEQDGRPYKGET
jgi:hypothetical protein